MTSEPRLSFPPFHLDLANEQLWRGAELLPLRPKALLRYLAEHPQRPVTQEELLKAVWQHTYVNEGLLRGYIRELRGLLGDDAKAPRLYRDGERARLSVHRLDPSDPAHPESHRVEHPAA